MRKRFFSPVYHNWRMYLIGILVMSTRFAFDIFTVWIIKYVGGAIETNNIDLVIKITVGYSIVFFLYYILKYFIRKGGRAVSRYVFATYFWKKELKKFFSLENTYVERMGTGRTISLLQDGINNRIDALLMVQYEVPNILIKVGFTLILLWQIGRGYVVGFFLLCICVQFFVSRINKSYLAPLRATRKAIGVESSRHVVRMIMNKQEVVHANRIQQEIEGYLDKVHTQQELNFTITHYVFYMFNIPLIVVQSLSIVSLVYAYMSLRDGTFSLGLFSALIAMVGYLGQLMLKSTQAFKDLGDQLIHVERLWSYMDDGGYIDYTKGKGFVLHTGTIELQDISFAYTNGGEVFKDFSVQILGGKKTALVGMSGSGKTTLLKLLAGYLLPDRGSVLVDKQDLAFVSLHSYYAHIGYLTQEPNIFDGTIKENLLYGKSSLDIVLEDTLDTVLRLAKCEFVYDLIDGIETEIGERGIKLSGGQRQRLAIAKIFLKDPQIILLDEPTSSLDSFAEESVTEAMNNLFIGRTVVIIAHRLQTVKHADDIIVLDHGNIIERGTHDSLLSRGGYYARMLELQSGF